MQDKVVVTGGAGFIGSHLTRRLVREGFEVAVFDSLQLDYGQLANLKEVSSQINFIRGDICDFNSVLYALKGARLVFHLAAISHLPICHANPLQAFEVNCGGTLNVLEASRINNVEQVVFAGSDHVYDLPLYMPIDEKHPHNAHETYAISKAQSIQLCKLYQERYGLDTRVLISGNVFGEFQDQSKALPIFIRQALTNQPLTVNGGRQTRDFYYVGNLVDAYLLIASTPGLSGESYNVGGDEEISIYSLAERIIALTGSHSTILEREYRCDESPATRLFLDKTKIARLGYQTEIKLEEGLRRAIDWSRRNSDQAMVLAKESGEAQ